MRALYQRRKSRALYDFWVILGRHTVDDASVIACFERYMSAGGTLPSRAQYEEILPRR
jgi:hypothetical protein